MSGNILIAGQPTTDYPSGVEVDADLALKSKTLRDLIDDFGGLSIFTSGQKMPINVPTQKNDNIALVFQYVERAEKNPVPEGEKDTVEERGKLKQWEENFFDRVDTGSLFNFILEANFLDIKPALDAGCKKVANMIKGKTPEELRMTFAIPN